MSTAFATRRQACSLPAARMSAQLLDCSDTANRRPRWISTPTRSIRTRKPPARLCKAAWSFQAHPDKMLCFQGLYGFQRDFPPFLNDCKTIENSGQTGFLGISDDSSQIVVTVISLPEQHFRKNIKTRCLQNYKQRIFICRSIIKIVSNHILSLLAAARKYTDKIETTSSDSG